MTLQDTISELFLSQRKRLIWLGCCHGLSKQQSEEIAQDVFVRLHEELSSGTAIQNNAAWLFKVYLNKVRDVLKSSSHRNLVFEEETVLSEETEELFSNGVLIQDCVERKLEEFAYEFPLAALAIRAQLDGMSSDAIGSLIGRSALATRQFLHQIKKKLSVYLIDCRDLLQK